MRHVFQVAALAGLIGIWPTATLCGGPPGHSGGGGSSAGGGGGSSFSHSSASDSPGFVHGGVGDNGLRVAGGTDDRGGTDRALEQQRLNADRNLDHRLDVADQLRDISDRNGNERLQSTASRMEDRATEQNSLRNAQIDSLQNRSQLASTQSAHSVKRASSTSRTPPKAVVKPAKPTLGQRMKKLWPFGKKPR